MAGALTVALVQPAAAAWAVVEVVVLVQPAAAAWVEVHPVAVQVEVPLAAAWVELVEEEEEVPFAAAAAAWVVVVVEVWEQLAASALAAAAVAADFADGGHSFQTVHAGPSSGVVELWGSGRMDCCRAHCHPEWRQRAGLGPASFSFQPRFLPWR